MSEQTTSAADQAKLDKITKPTKTTKPELPANVIETVLADGTVILNAVAL